MDKIKNFLEPRQLENCGWYWLDADDWDLIRQNMYVDIIGIEEDLENNQNYSEKDKLDLEFELNKLKNWAEKIPCEGCFFYAWW